MFGNILDYVIKGHLIDFEIGKNSFLLLKVLI